MLLYHPDFMIIIKSITGSVTSLKTKTRKTLILRDLRFKEVVPPGIVPMADNSLLGFPDK